MTGNNVTGGDLEDLWNIANDYLPKVEGVYNKQINEMLKVTDGAGGKELGRCHPWWLVTAQLYSRFLFDTSLSLSTAAITINEAIDDYKYVDGNSACELSELGEKLEQHLDGKEEFSPTPMPDDEYPYTYDFPDDWSDRD